MKSKLNSLLLLFLMLMLMAATVRAQCYASGTCITGGPPGCTRYLTLAPGSVYSEQLTTSFLNGSHVYYMVRYSHINCAQSCSPGDYFPVTITYNNAVYLPENQTTTPQFFIPTTTQQTITVNFDLTNPTFPNCSTFPNCAQDIVVEISFHTDFTCTSCNNDRGKIIFSINLRDHSLSSMDLRNSEMFYIGNDQHLHSQKWNAGWTYSPITPANGGWGAVAAEGWVAAAPAASNVFFKSTNNMLYNIYKSGNSWFMHPLSYSVNNVKSFIRPKGSRVYYVGTDCLVYYFNWNGSAWVITPISPLSGWTNKLVKGAMDVSQLNDELFYRSQNGEVYRLFQNSGGQWDHELLLASGCASNIVVDPVTNAVFFKGTDSKVHRLFKQIGVWQHQVLNAFNFNYQAMGYLTKFPSEDRVFFIGTDRLVHNVYLSGGSWYDFPLSYSVSPARSNALAGENKLFYFHGDNRIHNFYWAGTNWWDGPLVTSPANVQGCMTVSHFACAAGSSGSKRR